MQYQTRKRRVLLAVLWAFLLALGGMDISFAVVSDAINSDTMGNYLHWPMAVWYGLSVVLALIGYMTAKSRS